MKLQENNVGNEVGSVPNFEAVHERKSFEDEGSRVNKTLMSIENKVKDSDFMKLLMREVSKNGRLRETFVEAGYHLSATPIKLMKIISNKNLFLNECRVIPVLGIKEEVMDRTVKV